MMIETVTGLDTWFSNRLTGLDCSSEACAYVVGVLKAQSRPNANDCLAGESITLAYAKARFTGDFAAHQRIGDWVLFANIIVPDSVKEDRILIEAVGRLSYYACHRILREQWLVYKEIADRFPTLVVQARNRLT